MLPDDISEALRLYYAWARVKCPSDITYPHAIPTRRLQGRQIGAAGLTDEEAQWVDRALCRLREDDPEGHRLIVRIHADGKSIRWLASRGYGDRRTIASVVRQAQTYVQGCLRGMEESGSTSAPGSTT